MIISSKLSTELIVTCIWLAETESWEDTKEADKNSWQFCRHRFGKREAWEEELISLFITSVGCM